MMPRFRETCKSERGFTLVELVVVIAIMGVMAAIAVPMVSSNLSRSKERAFAADLAMIQIAVDSYYTSPSNIRNLGQRQYPIKGFDSTGILNTWNPVDTNVSIPVPLNPYKAVIGGDPKWRDGGNGTREEENFNSESISLAGSGSGWYAFKTTLEGVDYLVDTRNFFIDFDKLVTGGLLKKAPPSASMDNGGGTARGSYSWYVDAVGNVNALLYHFPTNGTGTGNNNGDDNRGFQEGVFP